jgi:hypothetical protein
MLEIYKINDQMCNFTYFIGPLRFVWQSWSKVLEQNSIDVKKNPTTNSFWFYIYIYSNNSIPNY